MIVHHLKNRHYARLFDVIRVWAKALRRPKSIKLMFGEQSKYTLDRTDAADWNKCIGWGGLKMKRINGVWTRKTEDFLVWRYYQEEFHVAYYKRRDYKMITPRTWQTVRPGQIREFDLTILRKNPIPLGAYFGGNDSDGNGIGGVAPKDLEYLLK